MSGDGSTDGVSSNETLFPAGFLPLKLNLNLIPEGFTGGAPSVKPRGCFWPFWSCPFVAVRKEFCGEVAPGKSAAKLELSRDGRDGSA